MSIYDAAMFSVEEVIRLRNEKEKLIAVIREVLLNYHPGAGLPASTYQKLEALVKKGE